MNDFFKKVGDFFKKAGDFIVKYYNKAIDYLKPKFKEAVEFLKPYYNKAVDFLKPYYEKAVDFLKKYYDKAVDFLKKGNNLYYAIGAVVGFVVIVVLIIGLSEKRRNKKLNEANAIAMQSLATEEPVVINEIIDDEDNNVSFSSINIDSIITEKAIEEKAKEENLTRTVELITIAPKEKPVKIEDKKKEPETVKYVKKEVEDEDVANKRPGVIQIYKDNGGKFRYRFWAANSLMVGHSRGYETKALCRKAINDIKKITDIAVILDTTRNEEPNIAPGTPIFEIYKDSENKFRFRLVTGVRVTKYLLASQGYTTKENCIKGIASIRFISGNHNVKDSTKEVPAK